jgi:quinol monooxygenase YgiN
MAVKHRPRENRRSRGDIDIFARDLVATFVYVDLIMNGVIAVVAYRPKPGKEQELLELVRARVPTLRKEGLVTGRVPTIMRSRDGTIVEVSEWKSREAIDAAHKNPKVLAMWDKFFAVCECVPLKTLAEANDTFAGFTPVED